MARFLPLIFCVALLTVGCGGPEPPQTEARYGKSRLVSGQATLHRRRGFSFASGAETKYDSGDINFSDTGTYLTPLGTYSANSQGGITSLGPVPLESVAMAPRPVGVFQAGQPGNAFYKNNCFDVRIQEGHTYCVVTYSSARKTFAKIQILQHSDNAIRFKYVMQGNGSRSFAPPAPPAPPVPQKTPLDRLQEKRAELERRIAQGIPAFRRELYQQASEVRIQIAGEQSASVRDTLERELREIAASLAALDNDEEECRQTIARMRSAERRLKRTLSSQEHLGKPAADALAEIARLEQEAARRLEVRLGVKLGGGAIEDTMIESKLQELRRR